MNIPESISSEEPGKAKGCNAVTIIVLLLFTAAVLYFSRSFLYSSITDPVQIDLKDYDKFYRENSFFAPDNLIISASEITQLGVGDFSKPRGSSEEFKGYHVNSYYVLEDSGVIIFMKPEKGSNVHSDMLHAREQITFKGILEEPDEELVRLIPRDLFVKSKRMLLNCEKGTGRAFFAWLIIGFLLLLNFSFFGRLVTDVLRKRRKT